ncbi:MAG: hypothetical protein ABI333_22760 [bacterium]
MHRYLYNGDDLWPKTVNLCARGRNALLDLDRGPGASFDLGLFGPAWEAHLYAVAVDRDPTTPWNTTGHTRLLHSWPVVSSGQTQLLEQAHALGVAARDANTAATAFWRDSRGLRLRLRFQSFLALRAPSLLSAARRFGGATPSQRQAVRRLVAEWARRLKIALLERLAFSVRALKPQGAGLSSPAEYRRFSTRLLAHQSSNTPELRRFSAALEGAAKSRGAFFDAARYRAFHEQTLLASLGPGWRFGRVTADQLRAIAAQLKRARATFDQRFGPGSFDRASHQTAPPGISRRARLQWRHGARQARLETVVTRELARLDFLLHGRTGWGWKQALTQYGQAKLRSDRAAYQRLAAEIKAVRIRVAALARASMTPQVRRRLLSALARGEETLIVGSFYFETEHLLETTSGFTHVGMIKRLRDPQTREPLLWLFDRVLGFHYAYPVSKLDNSVPVEALALSGRVARTPRRYRWLELTVPPVFRLGGGRISERVTLQNLFAHVKQLLADCPALSTMPGFYYSAITWITNHPRNRVTLKDLWVNRVHTGYGYRSLDPERLQQLRGRRLWIPVLQRPGRAWTSRCPRQRKLRRPPPQKRAQSVLWR